MSRLLRNWSEELAVGGLSGYLIKTAWKRYIATASLSLSATGMVVGIPVATGYIASDFIDPVHGEQRFTESLTNPLGTMPKTTQLVLENAQTYAGIRSIMHEQYGFPMPSLWLHRV
jgi:hypothetical protein